MKLPEHVDKLRDLIEAAFDKHFARLGIGNAVAGLLVRQQGTTDQADPGKPATDRNQEIPARRLLHTRQT